MYQGKREDVSKGRGKRTRRDGKDEGEMGREKWMEGEKREGRELAYSRC